MAPPPSRPALPTQSDSGVASVPPLPPPSSTAEEAAFTLTPARKGRSYLWGNLHTQLVDKLTHARSIESHDAWVKANNPALVQMHKEVPEEHGRLGKIMVDLRMRHMNPLAAG